MTHWSWTDWSFQKDKSHIHQCILTHPLVQLVLTHWCCHLPSLGPCILLSQLTSAINMVLVLRLNFIWLHASFSHPSMSYSYFITILLQLLNLHLITLILLASMALKLSLQLDYKSFTLFNFTCTFSGQSLVVGLSKIINIFKYILIISEY